MMRSMLSIVALTAFVYGCGVKEIDLNTRNGVVDLKQFVEGDWDNVCVLPPYTSDEKGADITGLATSDISKSGIALSDSFSTLVFLKGGKRHSVYNVPRAPVDLAHIEAGCYPRSEAVFEVEPTENT